MRKAIRRGDLFYADLNPVVGSEQGGIRPVLVIQNDVGNHFSPTVVAAAITSRKAKNSLPMVTLCTQKYDMGDKTLYNLVTEAFPIVLFVKKLEDNSRRVMEITECEILEDGTRQLHTLYR